MLNDRALRKQKRRIYYLGGLQGKGGKNTTVSSGDRLIQLPPVGDYIEVNVDIADDLMRKHQYLDERTQQYIPVFTTDSRFAARVKAGENPFIREEKVVVRDASALSDDELMKELLRRQASLRDDDEDSSDQNNSGAKTDTLPSLKKPAAPKKPAAKRASRAPKKTSEPEKES